MRDTWNLIDLKLGAFVRGQLLLVVLRRDGAVARVLGDRAASSGCWSGSSPASSSSFRSSARSRPERVAVGVGLTDSWQMALAAGLIVLVVRLLEDYVVIPKVLGEAVGLTPLTRALLGRRRHLDLRRLRRDPRHPVRRRHRDASSTCSSSKRTRPRRRCRPCCSRQRGREQQRLATRLALAHVCAVPSGPAPAAEDEAAEGEAEPERAEREGADRECLAKGRRGAASGRSPPAPRSSAARHGASCAARRPLGCRDRGRRRFPPARLPRTESIACPGRDRPHSPRLRSAFRSRPRRRDRARPVGAGGGASSPT